MKVYQSWKNLIEMPMSDAQKKAFWKEYLDIEKEFYKAFLIESKFRLEGSVEALAKDYNVELTTFAGILDGINSSLKEELNLEELEDKTEINAEIDKEKLYYNMLDSKAKWLYGLDEWDKHLTKDEKNEIRQSYLKNNVVVKEAKIGRNEPCPCGSGKKYKRCCIS